MVYLINFQKDYKDLIKEVFGNMIWAILNLIQLTTMSHIQELTMKHFINLEPKLQVQE